MAKTKKLSPRTEKILSQARTKRLNVDMLISHYGLKFVLRLIKFTTRAGKNNTTRNTSGMLFPQFKVSADLQEIAKEQYQEELELAGFKIHRWNEDFIDEDSGEVVSLERTGLLYI